MRRILRAAVVLCLFGTSGALGQATGRIQGRVMDPQKHPLVNAIVTVVGTTFLARTDAQGDYTLEGIPAGTVSVRAQYIAHKPREIASLRVPAGQTVQALDFMLEPAETLLQEIKPGDARPVGLQFRFQLIKTTGTKGSDPAIAGIDSVLKDLFRFPGYKLVSNAMVAVDYATPRPGGFGTSAEQLLGGDGETYRLSVRVDTASLGVVRVNVWLYRPLTPVVTKNASGGNSVSSDRYTLLNTTVTLAYGHTVVLGSTQPGGAGQPVATPITLILTVKPELRSPF